MSGYFMVVDFLAVKNAIMGLFSNKFQ